MYFQFSVKVQKNEPTNRTRTNNFGSEDDSDLDQKTREIRRIRRALEIIEVEFIRSETNMLEAAYGTLEKT